MFRFIHTADIHLDSPLKGLENYEDAPVDEIRNATRRAFDNLIDFAIEQEVAFVLICGDLYDGDWKDYNTGLYFISRMARLARAGIKAFVIAGNHDAANQITKSLPLPDNVTFFTSNKTESVILEEINTIIHGRSYQTKAETNNLVQTYPPGEAGSFNIGLLHTSLTGREGHETYAPCSLDELAAKNYDYWALGHIHKREIVASDPWIVFPGNLQGRHIRETGAKGATLVTVDNNTIIKVEHHVFDVVRWEKCEVPISSCETTGDVHNLIRESLLTLQDHAAGKTLALRLILSGSSSLHTKLLEDTFHWTEECKGIATGLGEIWLEKLQIRTSPKLKRRDLDRDTVLGALLQTVNELEINEETLQALIPELSTLRNRLPAPMNGESLSMLFADDDPSFMKSEVEQMLMTRLLQRDQS